MKKNQERGLLLTVSDKEAREAFEWLREYHWIVVNAAICRIITEVVHTGTIEVSLNPSKEAWQAFVDGLPQGDKQVHPSAITQALKRNGHTSFKYAKGVALARRIIVYGDPFTIPKQA